MKTALVHDWLIHRGGAEKMLQAICDLYPSPIHTLVRDKRLFKDEQVHTSFIQGLPFAKKWYRNYLALFPLAIEQFDLSGYDLIISSSHMVAKGVLTHANQKHLCYCHTPMRYAWDLYHQYLHRLSPFRKKAAKVILHYLRNWDIASLSRVDHFFANSQYVASRIKKIYQREATVIYPPIAVTQIPFREQKEDFYLTVSRLVCYKNVEQIVDVFSKMPEKKLVVIGDGPEMPKIKTKAKKNCEILGYQPDAVVYDYLARAKAFVFGATEDFGMAPVEAQAAGTPVIAFGQGGALETVIEGVTGLFFTESLREKVMEFERREFNPHEIRKNALRFSEERFKAEFKAAVEKLL